MIREWWGANDNIRETARYAVANDGGDRCNKAAADLAWKKTVTFLGKYL